MNLYFAKRLRKTQTPAEALLWQKLRNRQLCGYKFRRQAPIGPYIADFYCPELSLIIEVDGGIHALKRDADRIREQALEERGCHIIRFENHVVYQSMDAVLATIVESFPDSSPVSSPLGRERII